MKKRGATIKHQNATMPGLLALAICPDYETRLRLAVNALSEGWMEEGQFNDLADTLDMLHIGMASYSQQKPDPSTEVAIDVCREAMMSIRGRYIRTGKFGATGEELKAIQLLADVSLDFWSRRSGALFAFACQQLKELRAEQRDQAQKLKEETTMNARDKTPALPAIDGIINAAHKALLNDKAPLCAEDVAKSINDAKRVTKSQIKEAEKQLKELYGLGILESQARAGGVSFYSLTVASAQEAKPGIPALEDDGCGACGDACASREGGCRVKEESPPVPFDVQAELGDEDLSAADEMPTADPALLASANRMLSDRLEGVAHALRGCGLPALAEISGAEDLQMATAALSGAYQMALVKAAELSVKNQAANFDLSNIGQHLGCDLSLDVPSEIIRAIDTLRAQIADLTASVTNTAELHKQITSLATDVTNTRRALNDALNEADRMRTELAIERQARQALQEQINAAPAVAPLSYKVECSGLIYIKNASDRAIKEAERLAKLHGCPATITANVPFGTVRVVKGVEFKAAKAA